MKDMSELNIGIIQSHIQSLKRINELNEMNEKLLNGLAELTIDNSNLKRKNKTLKQLVLDKNKELKKINNELTEVETSKEILQVQNINLQEKLNKFKEYM